MYVLISNISINQSSFKVNEVKISKSLNAYLDKAVIKIPSSARLRVSGVLEKKTVQTAKKFNEGDKVVIELGYNGKLTKEFEGFVSRVNFSSPVEIECEGFAYQLRHKSLQGYWKEITVKELLELVIVGTDIVLGEVADTKIPNLTIDEMSLFDVLDYLKRNCALAVFFKDNVLNAILKYNGTGKEISHVLGWNVLKDSDLKVRKPFDGNIQYNYSAENKDGTKVKGSAGKTGGKIINRRTVITDPIFLEQMAKKKLEEYNYEGYEGKITTFLVPFTEPGDVSLLEDKRYPERSGKYKIESVEVTYGTSGARRINELGIKL